MPRRPKTIDFTLGAPTGKVLQAFLQARDRVIACRGPLGSGKTYAAIQKLLDLASQQEPNDQGVRPTRFVVVRNTYPDLMGTTVKDFREVWVEPHMGKFKQGGLEAPTFYADFRIADGTRVRSEIVFLALDRPDHVQKLRGVQCTGFWFNEMKELPKAIIDMADSRHGRYPTPAAGGVKYTWRGMIGDTNAPDEDHWYAQMEQNPPRNWRFFVQPGGMFKTTKTKPNGQPIYEPNPHAENLPNLPKDYYLDLIEGKSTDWIDVNVCNELGFLVEGKPVHPNYVDSVHCPNGQQIPFNPALPLTIGIDFGRTPAAAIVQTDPASHRHYVIDEFCTQGMSAALFAPELKRYISDEYPTAHIRAIWGDPAGEGGNEATEETPFTILRAHGLPAMPCPVPGNAPLARRNAVAQPLTQLAMDGKPRLVVSSKAKMIRKGLNGGFCYRRMQTSAERYTETPDKNEYSHPVEALEYALYASGERHDKIQVNSGGRRRNRSYIART